jgi:DNA-binding MarR family transcriptional regulator
MDTRQPPISLDEAVLLAISEGASSINDIASMLNVDRKSVIDSVSKLYNSGLIRVEESGFLVFRSKRITLTEKGFEEASKIRDKLGRWVDSLGGDKEQVLRDLSQEFSFIAPLLYLLGIMAITDLAIHADQSVSSDAEEQDVNTDTEVF